LTRHRPAGAQQLAEAALRDTRPRRLLTELCTQVGARPAGSAADAKAVAWAQAAMTAWAWRACAPKPLALRIWQRGPAAPAAGA
jgi:carboxypeptidase Q